jgi:hypothetical protein
MTDNHARALAIALWIDELERALEHARDEGDKLWPRLTEAERETLRRFAPCGTTAD